MIRSEPPHLLATNTSTLPTSYYRNISAVPELEINVFGFILPLLLRIVMSTEEVSMSYGPTSDAVTKFNEVGMAEEKPEVSLDKSSLVTDFARNGLSQKEFNLLTNICNTNYKKDIRHSIEQFQPRLRCR